MQEQYIALRIGEQIIQINGFVLNANNPEDVEKDLANIMNSLQYFEKPIDIVQYAKDLYKQ